MRWCSLLPDGRSTFRHFWQTLVSELTLHLDIQTVCSRGLHIDRMNDRFFIIGSAIGIIGAIIGATAKSVNTLIGAEVFLGIAVAFQQSFFWVVAELVPMRWRYIANSYCYLMTTPTSPLAARVAYSFQTYPGQWRNRYDIYSCRC